MGGLEGLRHVTKVAIAAVFNQVQQALDLRALRNFLVALPALVGLGLRAVMLGGTRAVLMTLRLTGASRASAAAATVSAGKAAALAAAVVSTLTASTAAPTTTTATTTPAAALAAAALAATGAGGVVVLAALAG